MRNSAQEELNWSAAQYTNEHVYVNLPFTSFAAVCQYILLLSNVFVLLILTVMNQQKTRWKKSLQLNQPESVQDVLDQTSHLLLRSYYQQDFHAWPIDAVDFQLQSTQTNNCLRQQAVIEILLEHMHVWQILLQMQQLTTEVAWLPIMSIINQHDWLIGV